MHRLLIPRLLLPVALAGCATPAGPRLLYTPDDSVRPVTHVESVREYDVAIASIASVLERDFTIPRFPVVFYVYVFRDRQAFEAGLLESGYTESLARDTASRMDGVGGYRRGCGVRSRNRLTQ